MIELLRSIRSRRLDPQSRLLLGQLVMFSGIAAIFPVAPLYVRQHGGGAVEVALFIAGPMVANTLVQLPAGHLVDRVGRKPVLIGSRLAYAGLAFLLFLNVGPLWLLALVRCGQGASGGAYVPALRAALADLSPADRRTEQYARLLAVEMVGLLIGPVIGGTLAIWTYSAVFLCAGIATLIGLGPLWKMPEPRHFEADNEVLPAPPGWWRTRAVIITSLALLCAGAVFSMYDVVWPQFLSSRHVGTFLIGVSISLFAVPVVLLATTAGRWGDRLNRRLLLAGAFLVVAGAAALYPELFSYPVIMAVGVVEAIGFMIVEPSLFAVLSENTTEAIRGRAMGMGGFFQFGGAAFGAGALGSLYGVSQGLPFWAGSGCCVFAAIICVAFLPNSSRPPASSGPTAPLAAADLERQA